jgi:hypothetical protein
VVIPKRSDKSSHPNRNAPGELRRATKSARLRPLLRIRGRRWSTGREARTSREYQRRSSFRWPPFSAVVMASRVSSLRRDVSREAGWHFIERVQLAAPDKREDPFRAPKGKSQRPAMSFVVAVGRASEARTADSKRRILLKQEKSGSKWRGVHDDFRVLGRASQTGDQRCRPRRRATEPSPPAFSHSRPPTWLARLPCWHGPASGAAAAVP